MPEAKALAEPLPVSSNHEESSPGQKLISDSDSQVLLCPRRPIMPAGPETRKLELQAQTWDKWVLLLLQLLLWLLAAAAAAAAAAGAMAP